MTSNSHAVLRAFVDRFEDLEGSIADLNVVKSNLLKELRNEGFDAKAFKALIKYRKDPEKQQEALDLFETYRAALENGTGFATRAGAGGEA